MTGPRRDLVIVGAILAGLTATLAILGGGFQVTLPPIHGVTTAALQVVSVLAGLAILGLASVLGGLEVFHARATGILVSILFILIALPLVGVTVGLPEPLVPLFGLLNFMVNLLNSILGLFQFLGKAVTS